MHPAAVSLEDLRDPHHLSALIALPESDFLERKRTAEPNTLAKVVSGLANAAGGCLLLGVEDDGRVTGWRPKGRAHVRDWLRDVLDSRLDPVPHFDAELFDVEGAMIGVVRVPRSSATPHYIDATGEVYERRNGQTVRARPQRVRELQRRGGEGRAQAIARLEDGGGARDVAAAVGVPPESRAMHARAIASVVRISLEEPSDRLAAWVHQREALDSSDAYVEQTARALNARGPDWFHPTNQVPARTTRGGHRAEIRWDGRTLDHVAVAWDGQGLGAVRIAGQRPDDSGVYYLVSDQVRDAWLQRSLAYLLSSCETAEAFGPAVVRWDLHGVRGADVTRIDVQRFVRAQGVITPDHGNLVDVDVAVDVVIGTSTAADTAAALWRQLELLAGAREL